MLGQYTCLCIILVTNRGEIRKHIMKMQAYVPAIFSWLPQSANEENKGELWELLEITDLFLLL